MYVYVWQIPHSIVLPISGTSILLSASEDFQSQNGTLTFSSDATESCFSIVIVNDDMRESVPECFTVSIVSATGDIDSPSVATACIIDDDGMLITHFGLMFIGICHAAGENLENWHV